METDIFKKLKLINMAFEELYKLRTNPFRMTPPTGPDEIIWAGFPELKKKFENRIKRGMKIPNSSLVLNWGEYGSGKTHSSRYFNKKTVLEELAEQTVEKPPYSIVITLPKGKEPVYDMFTSIIDKLNIEDIRTKFVEAGIQVDEYIESFTDNIHIQNVIKAFFGEADINLLKQYFYGHITNTDIKGLHIYGILRRLQTDSDYTKFLAGLFSCFTIGFLSLFIFNMFSYLSKKFRAISLVVIRF